MTERPILFSGEMVRAILDGRKSQTRRVVKIHPYAETGYQSNYAGDPPAAPVYPHECPYGRIGDRLWVRECFSYREHNPDILDDLDPMIWYWADGAITGSWDFTKPKPSIFMPRWASRLTLEIADVRVERLQAISSADARAEGCIASDRESETDAYHNLWDSLNAKRAFGWDVNPWVWVIEFQRSAPPLTGTPNE